MRDRLIEIGPGLGGWDVLFSRERRGTFSTPALAVAFAQALSQEMAPGAAGPRIRVYLSGGSWPSTPLADGAG